jgi:isopenicillin N synthase-like dioxygenase
LTPGSAEPAPAAVYAAALGLPEQFFDHAFVHSRPLGILRLSHYPATRVKSGSSTLAAYRRRLYYDSGAIGGARAWSCAHTEKKWIQAPALPGTLLVNAGEILRLWSNGRFRATLHRVINQSGRDRYAIPFFYSPSPDTLIACVETCCDADHPPQYRPVTVREYTEWFSHKVFVHLKDKPGRSPYYEDDRPTVRSKGHSGDVIANLRCRCTYFSLLVIYADEVGLMRIRTLPTAGS